MLGWVLYRLTGFTFCFFTIKEMRISFFVSFMLSPVASMHISDVTVLYPYSIKNFYEMIFELSCSWNMDAVRFCHSIF